MFVITSDKNGENDFDFDTTHEEFKQISDEFLIIKLKENSKVITQREKDKKQIEVYVYKYIDDNESVIWINNMT